MSNILARLIKGITLPPQSSDPAEVEEGSLYSVSNPSPRIKAYIQSATREVITNTQSQTLQNKLIIASENTIQVAAAGVTAIELNSALQEIQGNFSGKANTNLDNIVTTSIPAGVNLESSNISTSSSFKVGTKNQTTSSSGSVDLMTGNAPSSFRSGNLNIYTGSKVSATSSTTGSMSISTGTASGVDRATSSVSSGVLNMTTGGVSASNSGSGSILLKSGLVSNSDNNSGAVTIGTGNVSNSTGVSGNLTLETGMAIGSVSTTTGNIVLRTGDNGDQKSGDITLTTGLAGTDEGTIYLDGKEVNVTSKKITNLADGTASTDAVNLKQLNNLKSSETLFIQTFESVALTDFTQTGLSLSTSSPLHGEISALLTHDASVNQLFKQVIPVDNKFRNQTMVLRLDVKSNASAGNVVINIKDETNSANLVASEQLQLSNDVNGKRTSISFTIPETCASLSYTITALPESGSPTTRIDDIICELAETALLETAVELTGNAQTITIPLTQSGLVQEGDSTVRVYGANGVGSTGSRVLRFSTTSTNLGSDISYTDSSVNGASFTVNTSGIYSISGWYVTGQSLSSASIGVSLNATIADQATSITSLSDNKILTLARDAQNSAATNSKVVEFAWTGYLNVGDVLRVQNDGESISNAHCTVSKQGSLKQIAVSSDQKLRIPTSELRFEGASARGTSPSNTIVKFDTIAKIRGDAFTVNNDPVLGTSIVMKKAGKLDISTSLYGTATSRQVAISRNQSNLTTVPVQSEQLSTEYTTGTSDGLSCSWSGFVNIGDIIRICSSVAVVSDNMNNLNLAFQEQDISVSVTNTLPQFSESDSCVRVTGGNGFTGQTRLFSNVIQNIGSDVQYTAASGQFRAMSSGIYNITYQEESAVSTNNPEIYIYVNETLITIASDRINTAASLTRYPLASIQLYLSEGDIVTGRVIATGSFPSVSSYSAMTISKVGKPNVTGVDVTPFVNVPQPVSQSAYITNASTVSTANLTGILTNSSGSGLFTYNSTTGEYTALKRIKITAAYSARSSAASTTRAIVLIDNAVVSVDNSNAVSGHFASTSYTGELQIGQKLSFYSDQTASNTHFASISATALSDQILTAPETFSTDTAALTYAGSAQYTLSTLQNAPVGTFITFTYAANTNTRTQTVNTAPTQFASGSGDANTNGIQIFTRALNASSSAAQPAAIAIQIGKGLKGRTLDLYKSSGKINAGSLEWGINTTTDAVGAALKDYNEATGILMVDVGFVPVGTNTTHNFLFSDTTSQTSGYLVINASKSPALTGVPLLQPRIATLSEQYASGTSPQNTSSAYAARRLNTLNDFSGIILNSASFTGTGGTNSQIVLSAGTYQIDFSGGIIRSNTTGNLISKIRIYDVTNSTTLVVGTTAQDNNTSGGQNDLSTCRVSGVFTVVSQTTIEVQQRASAAGEPLGVVSSFGDNEVYLTGSIQKIK